MTHTEDVKRVATPFQVDFLNARIEALEKRVEFLEAQLEVAKQVNFNRYE
jgi:polyhydroxyalkanoate synthesis regulator phasin